MLGTAAGRCWVWEVATGRVLQSIAVSDTAVTSVDPVPSPAPWDAMENSTVGRPSSFWIVRMCWVWAKVASAMAFSPMIRAGSKMI